MAEDEKYKGPERRRRLEEYDANGWSKYQFFVLEKLEAIDRHLEKIDQDIGSMKLRLVKAGVFGAIAGAIPGLVTALFMYYSLVHKGP